MLTCVRWLSFAKTIINDLWKYSTSQIRNVCFLSVCAWFNVTIGVKCCFRHISCSIVKCLFIVTFYLFIEGILSYLRAFKFPNSYKITKNFNAKCKSNTNVSSLRFDGYNHRYNDSSGNIHNEFNRRLPKIYGRKTLASTWVSSREKSRAIISLIWFDLFYCNSFYRFTWADAMHFRFAIQMFTNNLHLHLEYCLSETNKSKLGWNLWVKIRLEFSGYFIQRVDFKSSGVCISNRFSFSFRYQF